MSPMPALPNFTDFKSHFDQVATYCETRRKHYRDLLILCFTLSLASVALLPWYDIPALEALDSFLAMLLGDYWHKHAITLGESAAFAALVTCLAIWLTLWPIFAYRGSNKLAGLVPLRYSFKDDVYSRLLRLFDGFRFAPDGGNFLADIKNATIFPDYQVYFAEDYIHGVMEDYTVKLAETKIIRLQDGERIAVFNGLLVIVDICDIKVRLSGNFNGRTVLIADEQKDIKSVAKAHETLGRFTLPSDAYEAQFEAYSSAPDEARKLLTPPFLDALLALKNKLDGLTHQAEHWDNRAAYAAQSFLEWVPLWPSRQRLPSDDGSTGQHLDLTKSDIISLSKKAANRQVQAEFYDDKLLITIPCRHDLFEPNSLFEPALKEEDAEVLYAIMQTLSNVSGVIKNYLSKRS